MSGLDWIELTTYTGRRILGNRNQIRYIEEYDTQKLHASVHLAGLPSSLLVCESYDDIRRWLTRGGMPHE